MITKRTLSGKQTAMGRGAEQPAIRWTARLGRNTPARQLVLAQVRELRSWGLSLRQIGRLFRSGMTPHLATAEPTTGEAVEPRAADREAQWCADELMGDQQVFLRTLDALPLGLAFFDPAGMLLHASRPLCQMVRETSEGERLRHQIVQFAAEIGSQSPGEAQQPESPGAAPTIISRDVHILEARYRLRGTWVNPDLFGLGRSILVTLECAEAESICAERLRAEFGLTRSEARVARLLAAGRSNTGIAAELGISPHTARHHTERVLQKLAVRSRTEVTQKLRNR